MDIGQKIKNAAKEGGAPLLLKKAFRKLQRKAGSLPDASHFFAHKTPTLLSSLNLTMEMKKKEVTDEDVVIAKRILASFRKAIADEKNYRKPGDEDVWDFAGREHQNNFRKVLSSDDPRQVADALSRIYQDGMTYGISNAVDYDEATFKGRLKNLEAALIKDKIVSFAELLGILPFEGPEQGEFGRNLQAEGAWLAGAIEKAMRISIMPPEIDGGLLKLKLGKGYFDSRDVYSLYTAWRISQLISNPQNSSLCEIGAGVGKVALYANRLGFLNYSIFDIPQMNVVQAWYLIRSLPEREIVLYGETAKSKNSVKILPPWEFGNVNGKEYDLTLNEDSFPEIAREVVEGYLSQIKKNTKRYLLSINQEAAATSVPGTNKRQLIASKVIETSGGFKKIYRFPFTLRAGYAEELYEIL